MRIRIVAVGINDCRCKLGAMSTVNRIVMLVAVFSFIVTASTSMAQVGELSDAAAQMIAQVRDRGSQLRAQYREQPSDDDDAVEAPPPSKPAATPRHHRRSHDRH